jgi:hypothetical protein
MENILSVYGSSGYYGDAEILVFIFWILLEFSSHIFFFSFLSKPQFIKIFSHVRVTIDGVWIGFIEHLQNVTTSNYSAVLLLLLLLFGF